MFKKVRQKKEEEWQATKNQFHKSLSRIRESFNRGKDLINDDLQEMEICVQEIKQARRKFNIKNDMAKMNEPDYDSDLSDFDKQFFTSSGRFNINQIKSSFKNYAEAKPKKTSTNENYLHQYNLLKLNKQASANSCAEKGNYVKYNKMGDLSGSGEMMFSNKQNPVKAAMMKTTLTKILDCYSDSLIGDNKPNFLYTENLQNLKSMKNNNLQSNSNKKTEGRR